MRIEHEIVDGVYEFYVIDDFEEILYTTHSLIDAQTYIDYQEDWNK